MLKVGDGVQSWAVSARFTNAKVLDTKFSWSSRGDITTADGFNAVLINQAGQFVLAMHLTEVDKAIAEIDISLPEELRPAKLAGDVSVGDKNVSTSWMQTDDMLKIRLAEHITKPSKVGVNFDAVAGATEAEKAVFSVQLLASDGTLFIEKLEGNLSQVAIVDDSPVPAPSGVMAESVEGENDMRLSWKASEDSRVSAYDILADGGKIGRVRAQTNFTHINLDAGATVSYSVVSLVTEALTSQPSHVATAVVGEDTTAPEPPMEVEESIAEDGSVKITWRASSSKDIAGYEIWRGESLEEMTKIATLPADKTEYIDENPPETEIHTVRSIDDGGNTADAPDFFDMRTLFQRMQNYQRKGELGKILALSTRLTALGVGGREKEWVDQTLIGAYSRERRLGELVPIFQKYLATDPENPSNYKTMGMIYLRQRQTKKATEMYEKVVALAPEDADAHSNLGMTYQAQGLHDNALASFKKALELDPRGMMYLYAQMARIYADTGRTDEISQLAEEFEAQIENQLPGQVFLNEGYLYFILGEIYSTGKVHDKAIEAFKRAVELEPEQSYFKSRLVRAYEGAGKHDLADEVRRGTSQSGEEKVQQRRLPDEKNPPKSNSKSKGE